MLTAKAPQLARQATMPVLIGSFSIGTFLQDGSALLPQYFQGSSVTRCQLSKWHRLRAMLLQPASTAPKAKPIVGPSGILCKVIASTKSLLQFALGVIFLSDWCWWGINRFKRKMNNSPAKKPAALISHAGWLYKCSAIAIVGNRRGQKLTANHDTCSKPRHSIHDFQMDVLNEEESCSTDCCNAPSEKRCKQCLHFRRCAGQPLNQKSSHPRLLL